MADEATRVAEHEIRIEQLEKGAQAWWKAVENLSLTRQSMDRLVKAVEDLVTNEHMRTKRCGEHDTEIAVIQETLAGVHALANAHDKRIYDIERNLDKLAWKVGLIIAGAAFILNKLWPLVTKHI